MWRYKSQLRVHNSRTKNGVTLLEVIVAGTMLAVIGSSLSVVLRTARQSWEANDQDYSAMHQAHSVALHFARQTRVARSVSQLASDGTSITLNMRDGTTSRWSLQPTGPDGLTDVVMFENSGTAGAEPLGHNIADLEFTGLSVDGTVTSNVGDIRRIELRQNVPLTRTQRASQELRTLAWIRSW